MTWCKACFEKFWRHYPSWLSCIQINSNVNHCVWPCHVSAAFMRRGLLCGQRRIGVGVRTVILQRCRMPNSHLAAQVVHPLLLIHKRITRITGSTHSSTTSQIFICNVIKNATLSNTVFFFHLETQATLAKFNVWVMKQQATVTTLHLPR